MKKFIETLQNIWRIKDLRERLITTVLFILVYRFGSFIVLPGVDVNALQGLKNQTSGGIMALLDMFSGGAFQNASIFALGIMPYISASIVIQLLTMVVPTFQKLQHEGESGRTKMNQYTRYLTVLILILQGQGYIANLNNQVAQAGSSLPHGIWFIFSSTIILMAGSMFVMWLGERITDKGIGNGISFIIMIGIIARFPSAVVQEIGLRLNDAGGGLVMFILEVVIFIIVIAFAIMLVQGTRKIPVQYAKRVVGNKQYGGVRQYIPLKVNAAGVMPIIFAQAIMFVPIVLTRFSATSDSGILRSLTDFTSFGYNFLFFMLIVLFTFFYTAITVNSNQMADDMKRNNGFIPGVKPGKKTSDYIDTIMSRITWPGSIFLGIIAILPALGTIFFGINQSFAQFFGGTSLLILVGVVLDTLQQVESHLLMRHYDGLTKSGRIKGRTGAASAY